MLLPIIHRFLHGDFFELSRKPAIGGNLIFFFQHRTDNRAVFLIYRPYKRRTGIFSHPRIGSIKDVMITRHVAGHIQQRNAFCATPDIAPHGIRPQLKRRAGGRVRALGVDHHLVVKTIFVQGGSRLQKRAPRFPVGGDLPHGLLGKLHIIFQFCHLIAPAFLSVSVSFFFLGTPLFASYPQFINRFRRVFNMDVHSLSTRIPFGHRRRRTLTHPPLGISPFLPFLVLIFPPCRIRRLALSARLFHHQPLERAVREVSHSSSLSSPISSSSSSSSSSV